MYTLSEFKKAFDPVLNDYLNKRTNQFLENTTDPFIKDFILYSKNLTLAGGKRIRPYIAYAMYATMGGKEIEKALSLFISLEIFHTFALMHDDVMDKTDTRHGVKTIHTYVLEKLHEKNRVEDLKNVSLAQAILMGDLYFSWAMEIFLGDKDFPHDNIQMSQNYFYQMVDEVILGQMIDIDVTTREKTDSNLISEKTRLKTSRYTFVRPMQIGAALAKINHNMDEFCEKLGTRLGIAFQLQDDLLDLVGDPMVMHKNILRDIADHQHTFFTNYIFTSGTDREKKYLKQIFGKEVVEEEQKKIQGLFISSGAIEEGNKLIDQNINEAKEIVENSGLQNNNKQYFLQLIHIIEQRKS